MFGLFIVLLILLIFYTTKKRNNMPPLAMGRLPIVGHTFTFLCNPEAIFKFLVDLSKDAIKKGGVVTIQIAGEDIYGIVDPEDANTVLNSCLQKDVIYDYFKPWLGDGLIAAAETTWNRHRKLLNPTFNQVVLHGYLPEFNKQARALLHILESKVGSHFDHAPALEYVTLQAICCITDLEDAHTVLSSCLQKDVIYDYMKPVLGEGLVTATETIWKKNRKQLNPTFNQVVLLNYLPEFNKQARKLLYDFDAKEEHVKFDHTVAVSHMMLQVVCSTAMGAALDEEDNLIRQQYLKTLSIFQRGVIVRAQTFWLHSDFIYKYLSNLSKRQTELAKTLFKLTNAVIKKRRTDMKITKTEKHFKPFLEHLLFMAEDGTLTDTEVKDETDTFTAAGTDTTSVTLSIALLAIGSFPEVQKNIYDELNEVFKGSNRDVEKQDLTQLKYLEAVIKETMRLYPSIPVVIRKLDKDVKIKNYTLPSGRRCFVSLYGVNRHPVWGPDAEQFRPERWLDPASLPDQNAFAAFGMGKRKCIGHNFAMMSLKTTLAHVLRRYRVFGDITQLEQSMEIVARPVSKDYISIERRT